MNVIENTITLVTALCLIILFFSITGCFFLMFLDLLKNVSGFDSFKYIKRILKKGKDEYDES